MGWSPETVQSSSQSIDDTLSLQHELSHRAAENLPAAADTPNDGLDALRRVADPSVDEQTRECHAVRFKNHIKTRWVPSSATPIPDGEKEQIKTLIVPLMLSATGKIQAELSEAIAVIGNHDFPKYWPGLLSDLESSLETAMNGNDFACVNGILATLNCLFRRFRCENRSLHKTLRLESDDSSRTYNSNLWDLKYWSDNFGALLLSTAVGISRRMNGGVCGQLLETRRLCCCIFYSLKYLGFAEDLKDKEDEWMNEFKNYVTEEIKDGKCLSVVDEVRVAVCEILSHYMEKKEEVLEKHLSYFIEAVWSVVVSTSASRLKASGMKFLSKCVDHGVYGEFIRRDMDGNGLNIRRRIDCELLLKEQNKEEIRAQIFKWLAMCDEKRAVYWENKESAIYVVVSLGRTDVVDVKSFFTEFIVPELQDKQVNAFPMLKAAALNFLTVFRDLIPKHVAMPLVDDVVRYVDSDWYVVHSYAAICIEKLILLVKDNNNNAFIDIQDDLVCNLVGALDKAPFKERNHYIMRCIMRVVEIADIFSPWMMSLSHCMLESLYQVGGEDPKKNQLYNHFLFEAVAVMVRLECKCSQEDPSFVVTELAKSLYSITIKILAGKVRELYPYMFQLYAQLVDLNRPHVPLPRTYMYVFDKMIVGHDLILWKESEATVWALARLLNSYLEKVPDEVNKEGRLKRVVVGIINKLVSSPTTEEEGFRILNTVIETYEYGVIAEYMNQIWPSLLARLLNKNKTPTLVRCVIVFMSLFLVKRGLQTLVDLVGVNLFYDVILREFWIPNLKTININNYTEVKLCAVASTKLLSESASLLDYAAEELLGKLLDAIVTLLSQKLDKEREIVDDDDDVKPDLSGYRLRNALGKNQQDWDRLEEMKIVDPKQFLVAFPAQVSDDFYGKFPLTIMRYLSPTNQAALKQICRSYNIRIV